MPFYDFNTTELDCGMRRLMLKKATELQPWEDHRSTFDSLELERLCGDSIQSFLSNQKVLQSQESSKFSINNDDAITLFVCPIDGDDSEDSSIRGTEKNRPFRTIHAALGHIRSRRKKENRKWEKNHRQNITNRKTTITNADDRGFARIVLREGVHFLYDTIILDSGDSHLSIEGYPGESVWISGGVPLPRNLTWKKSTLHPSENDVWMANLSGTRALELLERGKHPGISGLFTLKDHVRLTRARFPDADAEVAQWGYASLQRDSLSIPGESVLEWTKPNPQPQPTFKFIDLSDPRNPSGQVKNNSQMNEYNTWGVGHGGACSSVWGDGDSYWCGNASAGGWAEVDQECAVKGTIQIPMGMQYNMSYVPPSSSTGKPLGPRWKDADLTGAIVHAWHSQSWATHMFRVQGFDRKKGILSFTKGSGGQGGRNWCRCDQCGYAAGWCGQHQQPPMNNDTRLIGGSWYIENVVQELDQPGEWFYDADTKFIYYKPNRTAFDDDGRDNYARPLSLDETLVASHLDSLITIKGSMSDPVSNINISGIGFRDTAATYMREFEWGAPSGGDWALRRGGALFIEGADAITISKCRFVRVDGNAIFLSRYTRNVSILRNHFSWIGEGAMATWGDTVDYDARNGEQPRDTIVESNYIHDVGLYEKQSSGWGQAKACLTLLKDNIMFNLPRAAINFNDMMGGGNSVTGNLIWNSCRESGDHGPINSWDRMPFLSNVRYGKERPSFDPKTTEISNNFIFANYGGSQGVDNDDGSSFFDIGRNVFYSADGFKMDYGGHDSKFHDNLVVVLPYDGQNCYNVGPFLENHVDLFVNNTCVCGAAPATIPSGCGSPACAVHYRSIVSDSNGSGVDTFMWGHNNSGVNIGALQNQKYDNQKQVTYSDPSMELIGSAAECNVSAPNAMLASQNRYFTPMGNASIMCSDSLYSFLEAKAEFGIEKGSSYDTLPDPEDVLLWARQILNME